MVDEVVSHVLLDHSFLALTAPAGTDRSAVVSQLHSKLSGWSRHVIEVGRGDTAQLRLKTIAAQLLAKSEAEFDPQYIEDMFAVLTEQDAAGRPVVLIVNDAECLQADAITYLALLSTVAMEAAPRIVFVGLPAFWQAIETAPASTLKDLISARWTLGHDNLQTQGKALGLFPYADETPAPAVPEAEPTAAPTVSPSEPPAAAQPEPPQPVAGGDTIERPSASRSAGLLKAATILVSLVVLAYGLTTLVGRHGPSEAPRSGVSPAQPDRIAAGVAVAAGEDMAVGQQPPPAPAPTEPAPTEPERVATPEPGPTATAGTDEPADAVAKADPAPPPEPVAAAAPVAGDADSTVTPAPGPPVAAAVDTSRPERQPDPPAPAPAAESPAPPPPVPVAVPQVSAAEVNALLSRGDVMLAMGDIAAARLFYERAASLGNGHAATMMGRTFDPRFLATIPVNGVTPDPSVATEWYRRGEALGDAEATERLGRSGATGSGR